MSEEKQIAECMNESEEVSYTLSHRPTGLVNYVKSLFGFGKTRWFVTNQRIVEHQRVGGGFRVQDLPLGKIASLEYGRKLNLKIVAQAGVMGLFGIHLLVTEPVFGLLLLLVGRVSPPMHSITSCRFLQSMAPVASRSC